MTPPRTAAATAARVRAAQERQAAKLRASGWTVHPPEHAPPALDDDGALEVEHGVRIARGPIVHVVSYDDEETAKKIAADYTADEPFTAEAVSREVRREPWQSEAERAAVDALLAPGNTRESGPW